ncbi:MAG: HupE/UreJ family protein [Williamsia sp.]|nr:HupE/UreJ family protein [Williamsia sp.]
MFATRTFVNSRQLNKGRLFFFLFLFILAGLVPASSFAHPSPNSLVFLDVSPGRVALEVQMPVPELELAFGNDIAKNPETLLQRFEPQIKEYLAAHIHAYVTKARPWQVLIAGLKMDKGTYLDSNIPYWEVVAQLNLVPPAGENTRRFLLDYDVIMHQVINHVALVSVRSDWETGNLHSESGEATVIRRNIEDGNVHPLEVDLGRGSWLKGFNSMLELGMEHIREGTDHLLFLFVLLLPAMLLVNGRKWGKFGGIRYSVSRLLKIITAFTIGHSITLLIGASGWLKLPAQPVEVLIACSILVSAVHAVYPVFPGKEMYVAGGFGLIHGLAFATVLSNLHLDAGTLAVSILGFNLGIELMQLLIVIMIIPWLMLLSTTPVYKWMRIFAAVSAAVAALSWIMERISGDPNFVTIAISKMSPYSPWYILGLVIISMGTYMWYRKKSYSTPSKISFLRVF